MSAQGKSESGAVVVYTTPFCAPCEALKAELKRREIPFSLRDLMMDEDAADMLADRGIRSSPVLGVSGEFYAGDQLNNSQLDALFGRGA